MAFKLRDRVKERTSATGTGALEVEGAASGKFHSFEDAGYVDGDTFTYGIAHRSADEWETGFGRYAGGTPAPAIERIEVFESSNANALVNFSGGTKDIWVEVPAELLAPVDPKTNDYRLTGSSGVAVTTTDVTAITTLYWTPLSGTRVALYTGERWKLHQPGEVSLSLSGLIKGVCYDIFAFDDDGVVTLEALAWKKVAASNSPTAGSNKVINLADTATLEVGMDVTVRDGSNSEICRITAVVASTSITVDALAASYTTPDVYGYRARAIALVLQDGVYVKSGATTRRLLGTIAITDTTGQTEDSVANRLVWNAHIPARKRRTLLRRESTDSWTYSTAAWRQANGSKANQVNFVTGLAEDPVSARNVVMSSVSVNNNRVRFGGIGENKTTDWSGGTVFQQGTNFASIVTPCFYEGIPPIGRNYLAMIEYGPGSGSDQVWYGDGGSPTLIAIGLSGSLIA